MNLRGLLSIKDQMEYSEFLNKLVLALCTPEAGEIGVSFLTQQKMRWRIIISTSHETEGSVYILRAKNLEISPTHDNGSDWQEVPFREAINPYVDWHSISIHKPEGGPGWPAWVKHISLNLAGRLATTGRFRSIEVLSGAPPFDDNKNAHINLCWFIIWIESL